MKRMSERERLTGNAGTDAAARKLLQAPALTLLTTFTRTD